MLLRRYFGIVVLAVAALIIFGSATAPTTNSTDKHKEIGPGSTLAGGLLNLPPARKLGDNILDNGGLEAGATGWNIPQCWHVDSSEFRTGTNSLRFDAGEKCPTAAYAPQFVYHANVTYTVSAWARSSAGSNLQARVYLFDDSDSSLPVASSPPTSVGADWTQLSLRDVDMLPLHDGDKIRTRLIALTPQGQTGTGTLWFDDVTVQPELPLPISSFLLYPNFRGYLWQGGPQQIRLHVEVVNPAGMSAQIALQQEGGSTVQTVQQAAQASQEIDIDASSLPLASFLLHTNLLDSTGSVIFSYPDYRVTKVSDAFKNSLVNYVDTDNFLVHNGQKEFVWGAYDRMSATYRCNLCMYPDARSYETQIPGFNGMSTLANYQDTQLNAVTNIAPWSAMSPGPPAVYDYLDPALQALEARQVGYLQIVNNWVKTNRYRPFWASGLSDENLWKLAAQVLRGKQGAIGYYTFDEPNLSELPTVFQQYKMLHELNSGSVAFGALINANQIYRWRDTTDVIGCDPYPVGVPVNADEYALGVKPAPAIAPAYQPPMLRVPLWAEETERQVERNRPVWMVLQLFRQWGKFPTYEQMKYSAYSSIIRGANGILWWGFVSGLGMEGEWCARHNEQAYFDFKKLSGEVMGLRSLLILPSQTGYIKAPANPNIHALVKSDGARAIIFASNDFPTPATDIAFDLASVPQGIHTVEVYSEGRTLPTDAQGRFADSFGAYEAHVYILKLK